MPLKVLIIGAGVCGPAFATLLRRSDPDGERYDITVVERAPKLRDSGLQIDIRAQGISVIRKMGLMEAIRKRIVPESGVKFVDAKGRSFATFGKNDSGHGAQAMTSEYEIMRGDLVDVFYRASLGLDPGRSTDKKKGVVVTDNNGAVRYQFGTTVTDISQHDDEAATVTFSDGRKARFDLVVAADGHPPSGRRRRVDALAPDARAPGRVHAVRGPRGADAGVHVGADDAGERRIRRRDGAREILVLVFVFVFCGRRGGAEGGVRGRLRGPDRVEDAGARGRAAEYHAQRRRRRRRLLRHRDRAGALREAGSGRVVLLGDAGYCPSPITGMGTTLSLTGAYILAGELARHGDGDVSAALEAYEEGVRPYVKEAQKLIAGNPDILFAQSAWGVWFLTTIIWLMAKLRIVDLAFRLMPEDKGGLKIPEYPALKLDD
ncbi:hypothetical protein CIB48_g6941 [Xylaria polymorpha]|nr:hypothetical protein CIB48_g6941 [Xylaria polymorpha]